MSVFFKRVAERLRYLWGLLDGVMSPLIGPICLSGIVFWYCRLNIMLEYPLEKWKLILVMQRASGFSMCVASNPHSEFMRLESAKRHIA